MKVKELMQLLGYCDPEAEVVMASQRSWPVEHSVSGVATREGCRRAAEEADEHAGERGYQPGTAASDVILAEGTWLRYGEREAWHATQ